MSSRLLLLMRRRGGGLTYLFRDLFTTADDAPLTTPRTCEPGPGTLTVTQPSNQCAISGSKLVITDDASEDCGVQGSVGANGQANTVTFYSELRANSSGTTFFFFGDLITQESGRGSVWLGVDSVGRFYESNATRVLSPPTPTITSGNMVKVLLHYLSSGQVLLVVDGKLSWVGRGVQQGSTYYPFISRNSSAVGSRYGEVNEIAVIDLPDNGYTDWDTLLGIATESNATPSTGATLTSEADALHEFKWTAANGETLEWMIRRTNDTSTWSIRCNQAGSTIKTIEINAGETERASTAQTWTNTSSYVITVVADGESIKNFVDNNAKNSYATASFNKTATGVKITGFATGADLVAWPRDVSSLLPSELV